MKKLLEISSEERNRILEMHQTATRKNYLTEAATQTPQGITLIGKADGKGIYADPKFYLQNLYDPKDTITSTLDLVNPLKPYDIPSRILSHTVEVTQQGKDLGINPSNVKVTYAPEGVSNLTKYKKVSETITTPITLTFPAPQKTFRVAPDIGETVLNIKFVTNDRAKPEKTIPVVFAKGAGVQPGA